MEDETIIGLYLSRDESAIAATAEKYGGYCYSIAFHVLGKETDSEEIVNDSYLETWNRIPPHRPTIFSAFLGKITRSLAISRFRKNTASKRGGGEYSLSLDELSECIPDSSSPEREAEGKAVTAVLNRFLKALPETQRNVFIRRYWYIEPIQDIARETGYSESKIKSMLMRTRQKLKQTLTEEELL